MVIESADRTRIATGKLELRLGQRTFKAAMRAFPHLFAGWQ